MLVVPKGFGPQRLIQGEGRALRRPIRKVNYAADSEEAEIDKEDSPYEEEPDDAGNESSASDGARADTGLDSPIRVPIQQPRRKKSRSHKRQSKHKKPQAGSHNMTNGPHQFSVSSEGISLRSGSQIKGKGRMPDPATEDEIGTNSSGTCPHLSSFKIPRL